MNGRTRPSAKVAIFTPRFPRTVPICPIRRARHDWRQQQRTFERSLEPDAVEQKNPGRPIGPRLSPVYAQLTTLRAAAATATSTVFGNPRSRRRVFPDNQPAFRCHSRCVHQIHFSASTQFKIPLEHRTATTCDPDSAASPAYRIRTRLNSATAPPAQSGPPAVRPNRDKDAAADIAPESAGMFTAMPINPRSDNRGPAAHRRAHLFLRLGRRPRNVRRRDRFASPMSGEFFGGSSANGSTAAPAR